MQHNTKNKNHYKPKTATKNKPKANQANQTKQRQKTDTKPTKNKTKNQPKTKSLPALKAFWNGGFSPFSLSLRVHNLFRFSIFLFRFLYDLFIKKAVEICKIYR